MKDSYNREIEYLRISVTDKCNYRCFYCLPDGGVLGTPESKMLSFEDIVRIIKIGVGLGIRKVRFTGGEPLLRENFIKLVEMTSDIKGLEKISLTTNGFLLSRFARELKKAGVQGLNISINSLKPKKYSQITGGGRIIDFFIGLNEAINAGFETVKMNVVYLKGFNDDEVEDFVHLTHDRKIIVRFIELMPKGEARNIWQNNFALITELRKCLKAKRLIVQEDESNKTAFSGPSRYYLTPWGGKVGLIGLLSDHYCRDCNRLRLTSDGKLYPCLMNHVYEDLKPLLKGGDEAMQQSFLKMVQLKPWQANIEDENMMSLIGG